jgi:hypothetical protein
MTTAAKQLTEIAAQWREARKLYVVYSALLEKFALGLPPSRELESPIDRNEPGALARINDWFEQMDQRVHVHQLRQLLQTTKLGTEENLRTLLGHHLEKEKKNEADRDKIDFLLVQYLSSCAPPGFYEKEVSFDEIAQVLEPVLGEVGAHPPKWLEPLEKATNELDNLRSLRDLLEQGMLEQMRQLKAGAGEMYFGPTALAAITRFNFLVRRTFVRLIAADLHAIRFTLHELERRGVKIVDCTRAGLSSREGIEDLRQVCHEWKRPFRAAYAAGQNFKELIEIRSAVEDALAHAPQGIATGSAASALVAEESPSVNGIAGADVAEPETPVNTREEQVVSELSSTAASKGSNGMPASSSTAFAATAAPAPKNEPIPVEGVETSLPGARRNPELESAADTASRGSGAHAIAPPKSAPAAPASTPTPAQATASPSLDTLLAAAPSADLQAAVDEISAVLAKANVKSGSVANAVIRGVKVMLSSWEVSAYLNKGDETSDTLQRAVASRALLLGLVERRKRGDTSIELAPAMRTAQLEAAKIQARIAIAKDAKDIDSAVNLAATSKRLMTLLEEADKLSK